MRAPADALAPFRRDPGEVMRLARMGCAHPTRLSFLRLLLRRMRLERWRFDRPVWDVDARGVGRAVYRARAPGRTYSLVAFAHDLPPEARSDRVIATAWDATFALLDGEATAADLARLGAEVPRQEAGRVSGRELVLSRANRSVRLFDHVVDALARGAQPDPAALTETGYLMRTTAVYGSGKFGAAAHAEIADRAEMAAPFQAEMLTVWLIRAFTVDLAEHLARARSGEGAARLDRGLRRGLGVGNSTGLGMAPFLVRHPRLLNAWVGARETALARVRAHGTADAAADVRAAVEAARDNAAGWRSAHPVQVAKLADLRAGLDRVAARLEDGHGGAARPWDALWRWAEGALPPEAQEALLACLLEPHGALVDDLAGGLSVPEGGPLDGAMSVGALRGLLRTGYGWAMAPDYAAPDGCARFWYVSQDKLEPRLGERHDEPGADWELPLDVGRQARALADALDGRADAEPVARLLLARPDLRGIAGRVQATAGRPCAEIRDNVIGADLLPIDMLRCKLAFFGATRFDPRSDRWVRISLFQGAPFPDEMA